jgi:hypothetical protein
MNWRYSGSEQLDPPYWDEEEEERLANLEEEADEEKREYLREIEEYD